MWKDREASMWTPSIFELWTSIRSESTIIILGWYLAYLGCDVKSVPVTFGTDISRELGAALLGTLVG